MFYWCLPVFFKPFYFFVAINRWYFHFLKTFLHLLVNAYWGWSRFPLSLFIWLVACDCFCWFAVFTNDWSRLNSFCDWPSRMKQLKSWSSMLMNNWHLENLCQQWMSILESKWAAHKVQCFSSTCDICVHWNKFCDPHCLLSVHDINYLNMLNKFCTSW